MILVVLGFTKTRGDARDALVVLAVEAAWVVLARDDMALLEASWVALFPAGGTGFEGLMVSSVEEVVRKRCRRGGWVRGVLTSGDGYLGTCYMFFCC